MKKATVNPRPQLPENSESDSESSTDDSLVDVSVTAKQTKKRRSIASKANSNNATASVFANNVANSFRIEQQQNRRVSKRETKGQFSSRYSPTLYMLTILFIIALVLSAASASPVLPITSSQTEISPIIDGHTF